MSKFIIDANLPSFLHLWNSEKFIHVFNIKDTMEDEEIWEYAKENKLTIITKDSDFSSMLLLKEPPPKVIHLKIGNMKMKNLYEFLNQNWKEIEKVYDSHKLTKVYIDRIEGIE